MDSKHELEAVLEANEEQGSLSESHDEECSSSDEYYNDEEYSEEEEEEEEASEPSTPPPRTFLKVKRRAPSAQLPRPKVATNLAMSSCVETPLNSPNSLLIGEFTSNEEIQQHQGDVQLLNASIDQLQYIAPTVNVALSPLTPIEIISVFHKPNPLYLSPALLPEQVGAIQPECCVVVTKESFHLLKYLSSKVTLYFNSNLDEETLAALPRHLNTALISGENFPLSKLRILGPHFRSVSFENIPPQQLPNYVGNLHRMITHVGIGEYNRAIGRAIRQNKTIRGLRFYGKQFCNYSKEIREVYNLHDLPSAIKIILFHASVAVETIQSTPATVKMVSVSPLFSQEQFAAIPSHVLMYAPELSLKRVKTLPLNIERLVVTPVMEQAGNWDFLPESVHTLFIFPHTPPELLRKLPAHVRTIVFSRINPDTQIPAIRPDIYLHHDGSVWVDLTHSVECKINAHRATTLVNERNAALRGHMTAASSAAARKTKKEKPVKEKAAAAAASSPSVMEREPEVDAQLNLKRDTLIARFQCYSEVVRNAQQSYTGKMNTFLSELDEGLSSIGIDSHHQAVQELLHADKKYKENKEKLDSIKLFYVAAQTKNERMESELHALETELKTAIGIEQGKLDVALQANDFDAAEACSALIEKLNNALTAKKKELSDNFDEAEVKSRLVPDMVQTVTNGINAMVRKHLAAEREREKEQERVLAREKAKAEKVDKKRAKKPIAAAAAAPASTSVTPTSVASASAVASISPPAPEHASRSSVSSAEDSPSPTKMQSRLASPSAASARATPRETKSAVGSPVFFQHASAAAGSSYYSPRKPVARSLLDFADKRAKEFLSEKKSSTPREVYSYAHNASSAESAREDGEQAIIDHARSRVDLYFRLLVVCYDTKMKLSFHKTALQHGQGAGSHETQAAHRSILPSLLDNVTGRVFLKGTRLYDEFNATDELPMYVNKFDDILERRRARYLDIVNDVSEGKFTPVEGLRLFLCDLRDVLIAPEIKRAYQEHLGASYEKYKDKVDSVIYHSQLGTLNDILNANDTISMCYVYQMLSINPNEMRALEKPFEEMEVYRAKGREIRERFIEEGYFAALRSPMPSAAAAAAAPRKESMDLATEGELIQLMQTAKIDEQPVEKLSPEPRLVSPEVASREATPVAPQHPQVAPAAYVPPVVKPVVRIITEVTTLFNQQRKAHKAPRDTVRSPVPQPGFRPVARPAAAAVPPAPLVSMAPYAQAAYPSVQLLPMHPLLAQQYHLNLQANAYFAAHAPQPQSALLNHSMFATRPQAPQNNGGGYGYRPPSLS